MLPGELSPPISTLVPTSGTFSSSMTVTPAAATVPRPRALAQRAVPADQRAVARGEGRPRTAGRAPHVGPRGGGGAAAARDRAPQGDRGGDPQRHGPRALHPVARGADRLAGRADEPVGVLPDV